MILRFHYNCIMVKSKIESLIPTGSFLPIAGGTMTGAIISKDIIVPSGSSKLQMRPYPDTSAANNLM